MADKQPPADNTVSQSTQVLSSATSESAAGKTIGRFHDQYGIYLLYKEGGNYFMRNTYNDGSGSTDRLESKMQNGRRIYYVAGNPHDEYFAIQDGKLYCYAMDGSLGLVYNPL